VIERIVNASASLLFLGAVFCFIVGVTIFVIAVLDWIVSTWISA
jgi:hypothetical protein